MHDPLREQAAAPNPSEAAPASVGRPTDSLLAAVAGTAAHIPAGVMFWMMLNIPLASRGSEHFTVMVVPFRSRPIVLIDLSPDLLM